MDKTQKGTVSSVKGLPVRKSKRKKILIRSAIVLAVLLVVAGVLGAISYPGVKALTTQAQATRAQVRKVQDAWLLQDVIKAKAETTKLKAEVEKLGDKLKYFSWIGAVPMLGNYYQDGQHFIKAGVYGSEAGEVIADSLIPFADALGLKGGGVGNAEIYAQKAVEAMPKIVPHLDDIEAKLKQVRGEIDQVNPGRYPNKVGQYEIRPNIAQAITLVDNISGFMPEIRPILMALPPALGSPVDKTYLILFQNDKELRSTGGFITAFATARVSKGKLVSITSEDAYRLDDRVRSRPPIPTQLRDYLKVDRFFIRDANISPDYYESMQIFEGMYESITGHTPIDGIIALDTEFVRALLDVVGEVQTAVYKETFSSKIAQHGIPDVVYKLELYSEQLLVGTENRKDLIGDLMNALVRKVMSSGKNNWQPLLTTIFRMSEQKHLVAYSHDKSSQVLLEKYNFGGRIRDYDGDYLHVNSNNFAGLKGDLWVTQKIDQDIQIASDGTVTKTVKFTNTNPAAADGWLNPTVYTNWLRLYAPAGSKLVDTNANQSTEHGKQMFQTVLKTTPRNSSTATFTYELPFKVKKGEDYKLLIQKQPGTGALSYDKDNAKVRQPEVIIRVNGKEKAVDVMIDGKITKTSKFILDTDKEIKFKI